MDIGKFASEILVFVLYFVLSGNAVDFIVSDRLIYRKLNLYRRYL